MKRNKATLRVKAKRIRYSEMNVYKAENGYIVIVGSSGGYGSKPPDFVFETDASLFKFLRKHFCEGYK